MLKVAELEATQFNARLMSQAGLPEGRALPLG